MTAHMTCSSYFACVSPPESDMFASLSTKIVEIVSECCFHNLGLTKEVVEVKNVRYVVTLVYNRNLSRSLKPHLDEVF